MISLPVVFYRHFAHHLKRTRFFLSIQRILPSRLSTRFFTDRKSSNTFKLSIESQRILHKVSNPLHRYWFSSRYQMYMFVCNLADCLDRRNAVFLRLFGYAFVQLIPIFQTWIIHWFALHTVSNCNDATMTSPVCVNKKKPHWQTPMVTCFFFL